MKLRKPVATLITAMALTIGSVFSLTGVAHAGSRDVLKNRQTGRCLDDSFGYGLRSIACNGLNYQQWNATWGYNWQFKNVVTGRCIDDSFGYGLRSTACNGLDYQRWIVDSPHGLGDYELMNLVTGRCIDDSFGYGLRPLACNGLDYQVWTF
jgi:Ricin-type beta-trefoil lectin domain